MILVSSCLAGIPCRYDAKSKPHPEIMALVAKGLAVPACAECLGGLPTPREKAEITGGDGLNVLNGTARVLTCGGRDVTAEFISGANAVLEIARAQNAERAILCANSPSCGCGTIYDGSFTGRKRSGDGVTAAILRRSGIEVTPLR